MKTIYYQYDYVFSNIIIDSSLTVRHKLIAHAVVITMK